MFSLLQSVFLLPSKTQAWKCCGLNLARVSSLSGCQFMTWWRILAQTNPVACCSFTPSLAVIFCQLFTEKAKKLHGRHGRFILKWLPSSRSCQYPPVVENADYNVFEKFVITMYDKNSTMDKVDEARLDLFARKQRSYDAIPPTSAALIQHVKRSAYQAGCIWGQATVCKMQTESPANWGWQKDGEVWQVFWTTLPPIAQSCQQLTKCGCKTECRGRCKCYRFSLVYTVVCMQMWGLNDWLIHHVNQKIIISCCICYIILHFFLFAKCSAKRACRHLIPAISS